MKHILCLVTLLITTTGLTAMTNAEPIVKMETNMGTIDLQLDAQKAPKSVENFLNYVNSGFYDGTIFHRVIKDFMVQGGGFTKDMSQKTPTSAPIKNEADNGLKNDKYTVAMARTGDPNSATCQFFINTKDNNFLNYTAPNTRGWGYAVFGKVIKGQDIVDKIQDVATHTVSRFQDVPVTPVIIEKMTVVKLDPKVDEK